MRWDGFLDLHTGGEVSLLEAALDQVVAWPLAAVLLWLVARFFNKGARLVDFLSMLGVARVLQLITGPLLVVLSPPAEVMEDLGAIAMSDPMSAMRMMTGMIPMLVVSVLMIAWFVTLLVFGVRYASGLRRGKLVGAVLLGFLVAEVVSKLVLLVTVLA